MKVTVFERLYLKRNKMELFYTMQHFIIRYKAVVNIIKLLTKLTSVFPPRPKRFCFSSHIVKNTSMAAVNCQLSSQTIIDNFKCLIKGSYWFSRFWIRRFLPFIYSFETSFQYKINKVNSRPFPGEFKPYYSNLHSRNTILGK